MLMCSRCRSKNIQVKAWVDANTKAYIEDAVGSEKETYCGSCDECDIEFSNVEELVECYSCHMKYSKNKTASLLLKTGDFINKCFDCINNAMDKAFMDENNYYDVA